MAKRTEAGGTLNEAEENGIKAAIAALQAFVAQIDPELSPHALAQICFKVVDRCYTLKGVIDTATRNANLREWQGNVRTFSRGVSPKPSRAEQLAAVGIHSKEELNEALRALGLDTVK